MILNSPYISGSLTVTSNGTISGSLTVLGGITGAITGSATSASYAISASEASTLQGLGSASFAPASTFNTVSQSYAVASGSLSTRVTNLEATSSTVSSSFASTSGSIAGRVTLIEGQYATTGSNNFTKPQQISDVSNAISFTSTASLYTDGGLRVKGSSFISGTAYFNDVVVYGTSSIEYITSSQLAIGTNIITLNTDTPSIRFGGISVFDSGSNNLSTGSLFWDSEKDKWIYSNPSASTYDGGMLISGPRNTSGLGNEVGTTSCALMMGQGGDHITSSAIFHYGNATCIPNTLIGSTICTTMANASCIGIGTTTPGTALDVVGFGKFTGIGINASPTSLGTNPNYVRLTNTGGDLYLGQEGSTGGAFFIGSCAYDNVLYGGRPLNVIINGASKMYMTAAGVTTFACGVNASYFTSTGGITIQGAGSSIQSGNELRFYRADNAIYTKIYDAGSLAANGFILNNINSEGFHFQNNGTTIMRMNSAGNVGIGTCSPCVALDVNCNFGSIISATTRTNDACCSELRAGWVGGSYMRMGYHPTSAVGYIDNTYTIATGQVYGDIQFRHNSGGTMVTRLLLKADGGLILACGRTSSILANVGNVQEWVGQTGAVSNNTGWSLFSIANQYDILSMDIYVFTNVGSYQASKHEAVFGYTASTWSGIGYSSAFCIFKTGTTFNETMTICNLSGANINDQKIAIRVWGYGVGQNGTGGTNLITTSCLTRIK